MGEAARDTNPTHPRAEGTAATEWGWDSISLCRTVVQSITMGKQEKLEV